MADTIATDICVIGAGSAGLSVAAGAAQMGAGTVLIDRGEMGGDCLNTGCVPSKALLAAGRTAHTIRHAGRFGVNGTEPTIDFAAVHDHVHGVIETIAPIDSVERFEGLGVRVIQDHARFTAPDRVVAGTVEVQARRFVIATGSAPAVPPIPGLDTVPYLTNETIFRRRAAPDHLIVLGGGPIGVEMAQAHRRLGSRVTLLEMDRILPKDDPDLVGFVHRALVDDGIDVRERSRAVSAAAQGNGIRVRADSAEGPVDIDGSDLLVAVGRRPTVDGLDLEKAGVAYSPQGIAVDRRLRTSNKKIFAIGDVAGGPQFTHWAGYQAGIVIRNALFRLPAKANDRALPWVTFSDPELAQVGLTEAQARDRYGNVRVATWSFAENDRAQAEREAEGRIKVVATPRGRVLGAGIVGLHAGELLLPWVLAIGQGLKLGAIAGMIAPYPTLGEVSKRVAGAFFTPSLFSDRTRRVVRFLSRFG